MKGKMTRMTTVALGLLVALAFSLTIAQGQAPEGSAAPQAKMGTAFTYQGQLTDDGSPADGGYDFQFTLYDAISGGAQVGSTVAVGDVTVTDGLFTVDIDFGAVFHGTALWLEIGVREGSSTGSYTILSPRQALSATPYALGLLPGAVISGTVTSGSGILNLSSDRDGLRVNSAGDDGVYVKSAGDYGVNVRSAGDDGVVVYSAGDDGVQVSSAGDAGVYVSHADGDGISVCSTGDETSCASSGGNHGVEIGNTQGYGVYVHSAGGSGVVVNSASLNGVSVLSAGYIGVYANTEQANGEWGMYTDDKIYASNVTFSSLALIAQAAGSESLSAGDLVAVAGVTDPLLGSTIPLALVRLADANSFTGIIGVVEGRMVLGPSPSTELGTDLEHPGGDRPQADEPPEFRSADGPAKVGDYVALTVFGVTQVKVDPTANIQPGQRLAASEVAGQARVPRTDMLNGVVVTEGAPVIGIALSAPDADGLVWVLVNPQ